MKFLSSLLVVGLMASAAMAAPVTLFEDTASHEFGASAALSSDTPHSGSAHWRVDYTTGWETHGVILQDGQASLNDILNNDVSVWYRTSSTPKGQVGIKLATWAGGAVDLTNAINVTLNNDGEWHELLLDFSDAGSGLDPTVAREIRFRPQNWSTVGDWGNSHPKVVDFDLITVVPEPATMALLGIGGLGLLIRRKR